MNVDNQLTRETITSRILEQEIVKTSTASYSIPKQEPRGGGNGFVLRATDLSGDFQVALKFYFPTKKRDDNNIKRFQNEIAFLKRGVHPNLIKCLNDGEIRIDNIKVPFYVMPLAKGSMRDLLVGARFKNLNFAYDFFKKLGSALQYLHDNECFHRDLKPENVLLDKDDAPLLADLGLAHINPDFVVASVQTNSEDKLFNKNYFAPEQRYGKNATATDHRADICSFGYLLQEALTGRYPLGPNAALPGTIIEPEYVVFDAVISKCTRDEKQIDKRYQKMTDCLKDLNTAFNGSLREKELLAAFHTACRKVHYLAWQWPTDAEVLSAGTLRTLYLNSEFNPSAQEKKIIFYNLLLGGRKKHDTHRAKKVATGISAISALSLGWRWFKDLTRDRAISMLRAAVYHPHEHISAGAVRVLGKFACSL